MPTAPSDDDQDLSDDDQDLSDDDQDQGITVRVPVPQEIIDEAKRRQEATGRWLGSGEGELDNYVLDHLTFVWDVDLAYGNRQRQVGPDHYDNIKKKLYTWCLRDLQARQQHKYIKLLTFILAIFSMFSSFVL